MGHSGTVRAPGQGTTANCPPVGDVPETRYTKTPDGSHVGYQICGEVLVSSAVPLLMGGSNIEFVDRGEHALKGVPGAWRLFAAVA